MTLRHRLTRALLALGLALGLLSLAFSQPSAAALASQTVYAEALGTGWNDWSWTPITETLANASPVHSGSHSIAVTYTGGWSGLKLAYPAGIDGATYDTLSFWVNGGSSGGQHITVQLEGSG